MRRVNREGRQAIAISQINAESQSHSTIARGNRR